MEPAAWELHRSKVLSSTLNQELVPLIVLLHGNGSRFAEMQRSFTRRPIASCTLGASAARAENRPDRPAS